MPRARKSTSPVFGERKSSTNRSQPLPSLNFSYRDQMTKEQSQLSLLPGTTVGELIYRLKRLNPNFEIGQSEA
jgi:hypothetical protein